MSTTGSPSSDCSPTLENEDQRENEGLDCDRTSRTSSSSTCPNSSEALLEGIARITHQLLTTHELDQAIQSAIATLGQIFNLTGVAIHQFRSTNANSVDDATCVDEASECRWQWQATNSTTVPNAFTPHCSQLAATDIVCYALNDELSNGDLAAAQDSQVQQSVESACLVAIALDQQLWGYVQLVDLVAERQWSESEQTGLKIIASSMAGIIQRHQIEQELRESQQFLQIVMDNIPQFIFWKDTQSVYQGCNRRWAEMTGLDSPEQAKGRTDAEMPWTPEQRDWYLKCDRDVLETGQPLRDLRQPQRQANGEIRWRKTSKLPLYDTKGEIVGILGLIQDITEQENAEATIQRNTEQFRTLVDNIPGAVYRCLCDSDWTMEFISSAAQDISGYPAADFINSRDRTWASVIHPDDQATIQATVEQAVQTREPFMLEYRVLHQDGSIRWVYEKGQGIFDRQGHLYCLDGVIFDITQRKQAEDALRQSEATNQALIDAIPDLLMRMRGDGTYIGAANGSNITLYNPQESFNGTSIYDSFPYEQAQRRMIYVHQALQTGELQIYEQQIEINGQRQDEEVRVVPNGENEVLIMVRDITERKQAEAKLQQLNEELEDIVEERTAQLSQTIHDLQQVEIELRRSQQKMNLLIQHTPLAMIEWTPDAIALSWNPAAENIFGYSAAEMIGQHTSLLCTEDVKPYVDQICKELLLQQGGTRSTNTNVTKDGREIICEWYNTPLIAPDGEVIGLASLVLDVTEEMAAKAELQRSQDMLRLVIDTIPQQVFWKDRNCVYLGCNRRQAEVAGLDSPADIIGKSDYDMPWRGEETEFYIECDRRIMETDQAEYNIIESQFETAEGQTKWRSTTKVPLHDTNGNVVGILGMVEDITERREFESAVQEREQRFRTLVNNIPGVVYRCLYDETWTMEFISDAVENLLGYSASAFINNNQLSFVDIMLPDDLERVAQSVDQAVAKRQSYVVEYSMRRADGSLCHVHEKGQAVFDEEGQPLWLDGVIFDITHRKEAEAALAASENQYRNLIETANSIIIRWDTKGKIKFMNEYGHRFFGYEPGELIGQYGPGTIVPKTETSGRDLELLIADIATHPERYAYNENENIHKDGSRVWVAWANRPILDEDGHLVELLSIGNDATERRRMEEALRQSEQRFRDVSEAAGEYLWEIDLDGNYTFLTDRVQDVKGHNAAELLGRSLFECMPLEDIVQFEQILAQASAKKRNFSLEHRDITPAGKVVWERVTGLPLLDEEGKIVGFRGTGLSITKQKEAEIKLRESEAQLRQQAQELEGTLQEVRQMQMQLVQSEKMSSLGQLVAGVAHEINNPVSFIYGNLGYATDYIGDLMRVLQLYQQHYPQPAAEIVQEAENVDLEFLLEDLPRLLDSMKVGSERIKQIVLSLRTFSRMDEAEKKEVNIHDGIDSTLMILQNRLKARPDRPEIQIVRQYGDIPKVDCYAGQLNQVFMNVLSNAIDALEDAIAADQLPDRSPIIQVTTAVVETAACDRNLQIQVTDNGPGIPDHIKPRLFDPFYTTKPIGKGTGMGLSISYQIVSERHSGTLTCESTLGEGTTFYITIPMR